MEDVLRHCGDLPLRDAGAGEIVIREGEAGGTIHILVEGSVAVLRGDVVVSRISAPGALFGEMSVLLGRPYSATVVCEGPSRFRVAADGPEFLSRAPEVALHTARLLAQRLHDATTYLADVKRQYEGQAGHFGLIDRILGSLLNAPAARPDAAAAPRGDDPRL